MIMNITTSPNVNGKIVNILVGVVGVGRVGLLSANFQIVERN